MSFVAVNAGYNDSETRARAFIKKTGMDYPVLFDTKSIIAKQYRVQGVPTVIIANRKGQVVFKNYGVPEITEEAFTRLSL